MGPGLMNDDESYPAQVCPRRPLPDPQPYRTTTRYGVDQIIHPGICGICWKPTHGPTPHHAAIPAATSPFLARQMGWSWT